MLSSPNSGEIFSVRVALQATWPHAIKTPLSVIANAADDAALEGRELRETVRHYSALAEKQVVWHLKRARMAASATSQYAPVWIPQIFAGIFTVLGRAYQQRCIAVSIDIPDCLRFLGEREDLEEVLGNLLDNAFKWARSSVTVSFRAIDMRPTLVIDDDGPGVAQERYTDILKRGMRLDEVVPGSGLGLAIVVELVTLYNGNLGFSRSPQGGLRVELQLPMQLG
jgi:signal transduction histidine kinase